MKVKVVLDGLFTKNNAKPASNNMGYAFFKRYLVYFESVEVVARVFDIEDETASQVAGDRVTFTSLPGYQGPIGFLKNSLRILKTIVTESISNNHIYILRLPATLPMLTGLIRMCLRKPYSVELVGDPYDAYSSESLRVVGSKMYQTLFTGLTRKLCKNATSCAYVTKDALQRKYPSQEMHSYTSLELDEKYFIHKPRFIETENHSPKIVMVAMMQNYYKGHDLAISGFKEMIKVLPNSKLTFVGSGPLEDELKQLVLDSGLSNSIEFYGKASSGDEVFRLLDMSDILLLPSRQEGLPRVVIEAMSRGLPCVCSDAGGTAELVQGDQLLKMPLSADDISNALLKLCQLPEAYNLSSEVNRRNSMDYSSTITKKARLAFYVSSAKEL